MELREGRGVDQWGPHVYNCTYMLKAKRALVGLDANANTMLMRSGGMLRLLGRCESIACAQLSCRLHSVLRKL